MLQPVSLVTAFLVLGVPAALSYADEVYRWTDRHGVVHFTDRVETVPRARRGQVVSAARRRALAERQRRSEAFDTTPEAMIRGGSAIPFELDGNLIKVRVRVNDRVTAPFYIDTGASAVVLTTQLAAELGFDGRAAPRVVSVMTANGRLELPAMTLESIRVGSAVMTGLEALVNSSLETSLLGGSFLSNFRYVIDSAQGIVVFKPTEAESSH